MSGSFSSAKKNQHYRKLKREKKMKIINESAQHNLNGKINLLGWRHRSSRRVARRKCQFGLIFHFSLQWHTLHRAWLFIFFIWEHCSALHDFFSFHFFRLIFTRLQKNMSEFFISIIFFAFDRSVKTDTLCVPLQSFIIFFMLLFAAFFSGHIDSRAYMRHCCCYLTLTLTWFRLYG